MGRKRRLVGWGFEGESYSPSQELLAWCRQRLGETRPGASIDLSTVRLPGHRDLPDLGLEPSTEYFDRMAHCRGQGLPDILRMREGNVPALPDAVLRPTNAEEVETVLRRSAAGGLRLIPWGGGSSVTGAVNVLASEVPTVILDLERLAGLQALDTTSGLATFGAGTFGPQIEAALEPSGLTLGHFPQSWELSTLGGWVVTRSSGQESLGYGRIDDMVAGLELVAPAGRLSLAPQPASAAGPDLRRLVLGSEGRLGVLTNVTVRVRPKPEAFEVEAALLPSWPAALEAARNLVQGRVPLHLLRLSDEPETEVAMAVGLGRHFFAPLVRQYLRWKGIRGGCLVFCGAGGGEDHIDETLSRARTVLRRFGGVSLGQGPGRKWRADRFRHPYLRDGLLDLGIATDTLETAAPWSRLEALTATVRRALESALQEEGERVAVLCHLSHPYPDGASLYFTFFFRCAEDSAHTLERWAKLKRAATEALVEAGATVSHHHGVGQVHAPWLPREIGAEGIGLLQAAARHMDPQGILNPNTLLDPADHLED